MKRSSRAGFTLIELLVVMAIIAIFTSLVATSLSSVFNGSTLTQANMNMVGVFSFARQAAITQNQAMEVRFYQYALPPFPGEVNGNANSGRFRAVQVFEMTDQGTAVVWNALQRLPQGMIMDSSATLSSLLNTTLTKSWTTLDPQYSLPNIGTSYNCRAFRFRSDGSTDLPTTPAAGGTWCVTLHALTLGDNLATLPKNFATIQIDPIGGRPISFRP